MIGHGCHYGYRMPTPPAFQFPVTPAHEGYFVATAFAGPVGLSDRASAVRAARAMVCAYNDTWRHRTPSMVYMADLFITISTLCTIQDLCDTSPSSLIAILTDVWSACLRSLRTRTSRSHNLQTFFTTADRAYAAYYMLHKRQQEGGPRLHSLCGQLVRSLLELDCIYFSNAYQEPVAFRSTELLHEWRSIRKRNGIPYATRCDKCLRPSK